MQPLQQTPGRTAYAAPPLFFNPLISAKSQRDFISLSHAVSRQSFLPSSAFLTRCFSALGVSQCSSSFVFPNTVSRGCCSVFFNVLFGPSREEMLFWIIIIFFFSPSGVLDQRWRILYEPHEQPPPPLFICGISLSILS